MERRLGEADRVKGGCECWRGTGGWGGWWWRLFSFNIVDWNWAIGFWVEIFTRQGRVMVGTQEGEWEGDRFSPYCFLYLSMILSMYIIYCKNKIHKPQIEFSQQEWVVLTGLSPYLTSHFSSWPHCLLTFIHIQSQLPPLPPNQFSTRHKHVSQNTKLAHN